MKKSRGKYEYERHMSIAQVGVDQLARLGIDPETTRAEEILANYGGSVAAWVKQYERS